MRGEVDPKIEAVRAAYDEAMRRRRDAGLALTAAYAAAEAARVKHHMADAAAAFAGLALDDATNPPTCEMWSDGQWKRVVISRRTHPDVWVRDYGLPHGPETKFTQVNGEWNCCGDYREWAPPTLRGVP